jgi:hypothetical protein
MTLGDLELIPLIDGYFGLDGGAMFGVIPKPLWERRAPADDRNRIRLATRPLVVRGEKTVIIDAGIGDKMDAKSSDIYAIDRRESLDVTMARAGLRAEDVDVALASHLHFDHAGGFTVRDPDGALRPRFPNARYVIRRGEWEDATHPHERNRASYVADNFVPLAGAGAASLPADPADVLRARLAEAQERIRHLEAEVGFLRRERAEVGSQADDERERAIAERDAARAAQAAAERERDAARAELERRRERLQDVEERRAEAERAAEDARRERAAVVEDIRSVARERDVAERDRARTERELEAARVAREAAERERDEAMVKPVGIVPLAARAEQLRAENHERESARADWAARVAAIVAVLVAVLVLFLLLVTFLKVL